jgi:hypothetical protein
MTKPEAIDLLMLLSALESVMLRDSILPEHLGDRIDTAVAMLRTEVLTDDNP